jgi:hypothetical protein
MSIHLDDRMWNEVFRRNGKRNGVVGEAEQSPDVFYVLGKLGGDANAHAQLTSKEKIIDSVVQMMQPSPAMTHIELLIPPMNAEDEMHFGTYLGKTSGWGSCFAGGQSYYLVENAHAWCAIPVVAESGVRRIRDECMHNEGTPYGPERLLFNYPFSVPPFRSLAWLLPQGRLAPAHCAALTARCINAAIPEIELNCPSAWYGPTTLFNELSRPSRIAAYRKRDMRRQHVNSLAEVEETETVIDVLLRGSDSAVGALTTAQCKQAINALTIETTLAMTNNNNNNNNNNSSAASAQAQAQAQQNRLAVGLLRWSQLQHTKY